MKMAKCEEIVNQSVRVDKRCQTFQSHSDGHIHVATANSCHTLQQQLVILVTRSCESDDTCRRMGGGSSLGTGRRLRWEWPGDREEIEVGVAWGCSLGTGRRLRWEWPEDSEEVEVGVA